MSIVARGKEDPYVKKIKRALEEYEAMHPGAEASLYRQSAASIRIRVLNPAFAGKSKHDRHVEVFGFLADRLDEDTLQEITMLLLLTDSESSSSLVNMEFTDPIPSML